MSERNLPWAYRPCEHDDWGWIRDAEGDLAACARGEKGGPTHDEHRVAGTDPYGEYAALIVKAVNSHDALILLLHSVKAYLVIDQLAPAIHGFEVEKRKAYRDHLVEQIGAALAGAVSSQKDSGNG